MRAFSSSAQHIPAVRRRPVDEAISESLALAGLESSEAEIANNLPISGFSDEVTEWLKENDYSNVD